MTKKLLLHFGVFTPSIEDQLTEQDIKCTFDWCAFEEDRTALNRLAIRGLLSDSQLESVEKRLLNKIASAVSKG